MRKTTAHFSSRVTSRLHSGEARRGAWGTVEACRDEGRASQATRGPRSNGRNMCGKLPGTQHTWWPRQERLAHSWEINRHIWPCDRGHLGADRHLQGGRFPSRCGPRRPDAPPVSPSHERGDAAVYHAVGDVGRADDRGSCLRKRIAVRSYERGGFKRAFLAIKGRPLQTPPTRSWLFRAFGEAGLRVTSGIYPCAELFYRILPPYSMNSYCRPAWHVPRVACRLPLLQEEITKSAEKPRHSCRRAI